MKKNIVHRKKTHTTRTAKQHNIKSQPQDTKKEHFFIKVYVCLILVVVCFALSKMESSEATLFNKRLKEAISESITVEEARQMGEAGLEKIEAFKNGVDDTNK